MATTTTKTTTQAPTTEVKVKATRKPREVKDRYIVARPHPTYQGLHQVFNGSSWIVIELTTGWQNTAPTVDSDTTRIAVALIGSDVGVQVIKATPVKKGGLLNDILDGIGAVTDVVDAVDKVINQVSQP